MINIFMQDQLWKLIVNNTFHKTSFMNNVGHEAMNTRLVLWLLHWRRKSFRNQLVPIVVHSVIFWIMAMKDCWSWMISTDRCIISWPLQGGVEGWSRGREGKLRALDGHWQCREERDIALPAGPSWQLWNAHNWLAFILCSLQTAEIHSLLPKPW